MVFFQETLRGSLNFSREKEVDNRQGNLEAWFYVFGDPMKRSILPA